MPSLEWIAVVLTLVAVYLTTRQIVWCWPLSMVSVILYALVFHQAKLYALMGLQGVYFVLAIYGWWAWLRGGEVLTRIPAMRPVAVDWLEAACERFPNDAILRRTLGEAPGVLAGGRAVGRRAGLADPVRAGRASIRVLISFSISSAWYMVNSHFSCFAAQ